MAPTSTSGSEPELPTCPTVTEVGNETNARSQCVGLSVEEHTTLTLAERWVCGDIGNFEYLMALNTAVS
jgi:hypothetical protein